MRSLVYAKSAQSAAQMVSDVHYEQPVFAIQYGFRNSARYRSVRRWTARKRARERTGKRGRRKNQTVVAASRQA
ncbi:hypothetical protein LLE49_04750 [Alicyclobacillus tolerans]|uniref:hypothetical protein n=1 Tax=Alicyclobacillus tolerans TaxID=90970 RepID=UPI001F37F0A7|nr:hypothetical protein [Alicyclobacillus tolerans]MCF8564046.1 hypothetical protein [Alicyclobacillus tolerans]